MKYFVRDPAAWIALAVAISMMVTSVQTGTSPRLTALAAMLVAVLIVLFFPGRFRPSPTY